MNELMSVSVCLYVQNVSMVLYDVCYPLMLTLASTVRLVMVDTMGLMLLNWLELKHKHSLAIYHPNINTKDFETDLTLPDYLQVKLDRGVLF